MPLFYYKVAREDGSVLTKEVEADSEDLLRRQLEESGYLVLQLRKRKAIGLGLSGLRRKQTSEEFLVFNQELLVLIRAGLPIVQCLDILMERTPNESYKTALTDVKNEIKGGKAMSDAMAGHLEYFSELYCNSLRAGERTGNLPEVIERFISYQKRLLAVKRQLLNALTYPVFLIFATTAVLVVLLTYVVPSFSEIYAGFQAQLPLPTVILINTTRFIREYLLIFIVVMALLVFLFRYWIHTEKGRNAVDGYILNLPLVGKLVRGYFISTMTRTLATILAGGIPMLQALDMVARSITNKVISSNLRYALERVRGGMSLAGALDETGMMPEMSIRMIEVGEATGSLEVMLNDISNFYEEEVNLRLQRLTNLIEPVIMLCMGVVVGGIVIVMYMPIFELAGTVK